MSNERPPLRGLLVIAAIVAVSGAILAVTAGAANPGQGTLTLDSSTTGWQGRFYENGMTQTTAMCAGGEEFCDHFELNVDVDPSHWTNNGAASRSRSSGPTRATTSTCSSTTRTERSSARRPNGGTSSRARLHPRGASGTYRVEVTPWGVTDSGYQGGAYIDSRARVAGPGGGEVPAEPLSDTPARTARPDRSPARAST